jgi:hypothetical protein
MMKRIVVVFAVIVGMAWQPVPSIAATAQSYCHQPIPGVPAQLTQSAAPFAGSSADWNEVASAIGKGDWVKAKTLFEKSSTFRARPYTGVREPADTLYREGEYRQAFLSEYQLAFCSDASTLTFNDRDAAELYKTALQEAINGNYAAAKAALQKDIQEHPSFLLGKNALAELFAITNDRRGARGGWQNVALSGHLGSQGQPNQDSLDAVELLLYADRGIVADTAGVSEIKTPPPATPTGLAAGASSKVVTNSAASDPQLAFDVVTSWADAPPQSQYGQQLRYYHVRVYLHPTEAVAVHSKDFRVDGTYQGRSQTFTGLPRSAPIVQKESLATGRLTTTYAPSVSSSEDLGVMFNLQMAAGDTKTVVVTFAVPVEASLSDAQLHSIRWASPVPPK